jgi:heptosyltransferase-1
MVAEITGLIDFRPKSILIIRLSAIGDVIMASALIPALRNAFPDARLVWLTEDSNAGLLQSNPRLDAVVAWPRRRWSRLLRERRYRTCWSEFRALVGSLRGERFELVLDLQGLLKSGLWALFSGGRTRIGLGSREGSQWLMSRVVDRRVTSDRIGKEYLKLARELGIETGPFPMDIAPSPQEQAEAAALLAASGIGGSFAVIAPFTTRPQKHWFDERWVQLSVSLADARKLQVVMLGGPADQPQARAIAARAPGLVDLAGQTSLGQCAAIIQRAALLIGVDTGLTHLGIAMRTPTLGLFGSTRPYLDTGFERAMVLYEPLPCSPCRRHPTCDGEFTCMRLHTVDRVLSAAEGLLERTA